MHVCMQYSQSPRVMHFSAFHSVVYISSSSLFSPSLPFTLSVSVSAPLSLSLFLSLYLSLPLSLSLCTSLSVSLFPCLCLGLSSSLSLCQDDCESEYSQAKYQLPHGAVMGEVTVVSVSTSTSQFSASSSLSSILSFFCVHSPKLFSIPLLVPPFLSCPFNSLALLYFY